MLADEGRFREALDEYQKAVNIVGGNAAINYNIGNALLGLGRFEEAAEEYRKVLNVAPDDADAAKKLAEVNRKIAERQKAAGQP